MLHKETIEQGTLELLIDLQKNPVLKNFQLAGGTSLALQIGHRISIDLDLFTQNDFDSNEMLEILESEYNFRMNFSARNTLKGCINDVNIDLISHKYPFVKPIIDLEGVRLFSVEDISAMKLNAIAGNGTRSKDFIDIYFILKSIPIDIIIESYNAKYSNRNLLHVLKSLTYFEDIDISDWPNLILEKKLNLKLITKNIENAVKNYSVNSNL